MRFLIPRGRWGLLGRAALAAFIVIACAGAATTVAGLLQVKTLVHDFKLGKPIGVNLPLPAPGAPETLLLIGADKRLHQKEKGGGNTDTMMLVRLNDSSQTINVLSVPRDLEVTLPGVGQTKLNDAYAVGGPKLLIKTLQNQVFPGLTVNHIMVASFLGFAHLINDIGCVYVPVDHRYYNHNDPADDGDPNYPDNFSNIDLYPGYQQLCGQAGGEKSALAFVRERHFDNDEVRNARQQDFLRWTKDQFTVSYLRSHYAQLAREFGKNVQINKSLDTVSGLIGLFDVLINADGDQVKTVKFPEVFGPTVAGEPSYVQASSPGAEKHSYQELITPTKATVVKKKTHHPHKHHHKHAFKVPAGMIADPSDGQSQSKELGNPGIPIYYPQSIPSAYGYCFTVSGNCDESSLEPDVAYNNSYPRRYEVSGHRGHRYKAWVMTMLYDAANPNYGLASGQYVNVQGLQWKNPPLLRKPTRAQMVNGKQLLIYSQGGVISTVAWRKSHAVYWIQNTLQNSVPNQQMIAMAATLTPYPPSLNYGQSSQKRDPKKHQ